MATRRNTNIQTSAIVPRATIIFSTVLLTIIRFFEGNVIVRIRSVTSLEKITG